MHCPVSIAHSFAMVGVTLLLTLLPAWAACSGEGNIRLLQDEVAVALKACTNPTAKESTNQRQRRSDDSYDTSPRIDDGMKQVNTYSHERRNSNDTDQALNVTDYDYEGYGSGNKGEKLFNTGLEFVVANNTRSGNIDNINRTKRSEPLLDNPDNDQCLSQCVFANLQMVDSRGIPREADLWNKVQTAVTSQQSRAALHDQIRACFQELQSEAEDNGCSYSNKLERCLMLRFADRKPDAAQNGQNQRNEDKTTA